MCVRLGLIGEETPLPRSGRLNEEETGLENLRLAEPFCYTEERALIYLTILLFAMPIAYGIVPTILIVLFQNPLFLEWYKQSPWLKVFLTAMGATLLRLIVIVLSSSVMMGIGGGYFDFLLLLESMIATPFPGIVTYVERFLGPFTNQGAYPVFAVLIVSAHVNFLFWLAVFSCITWRNRPIKPKTRPLRSVPPDRWAGRG